MTKEPETRLCEDCRFCTDFGPSSGGLRCQWEKRHLPPPVFRKRLWGADAPQTWNTAAETCAHFEGGAR